MDREVLVKYNGDTYAVLTNERSADWYDSMFEHEPSYKKLPEESVYYPVWKKIVDKIGVDEKVADFGCGSGQLARMLIASGRNFVLGLDFSYRAIALARDNNRRHRDRFYCGNLYNRPVYCLVPFDCAVITEVLEHLENDLMVLNHLPIGCHIIFTVPNYYTPMHVRVFQSASDVMERYWETVAIETIESVVMNVKEDWRIWVVDGRKNE